ncbi:ABC transporter substrate-binding protein [Paenibacillus ginsengarvi]|uniref:Extracellular solute-binding protein n=1 Tax=Paenibacillus ginsengarvi TaxID=400777 RepID=A0A3B0ARI4_9BACL|nr:extracellular solute-binding protein [Paenibacillus ginsengarvi]RKN61936.1 extracellular solute-binding protein [Paenibacillus ginsengarvi]
MISFRKKMVGAVSLVLLIATMASCSSANKDPVNRMDPSKTLETNSEPVTLKLMWFNTLVAKEAVEQFISVPVKQRYPHITVEFVDVKPGASLPDLISTGQSLPDLVITDYSNLSTAIDLKYPSDLNEALRASKVDLNVLEASPLEGVRALGAKGELYGLPLYMDKYMMFYNKDIFEQFAIPAPTTDMSYTDLIALVKRLTRSEGGIKYLGYRWGDLYTFGSQLGLPVINAKTGKADLQSDGWKRALSLMKEMVDLGIDNKITHEHFFKEKRLAIYPQWMGAAYGLIAQEGGALNWDMAAMPYSSNQPLTSGPTKPIYLLASAAGKHKEQAIAAISYLVTSPDVQTLLSQHGRISVLKDKSIQQQFGTKLQLLQGKNTSAVFKYPFGKLPNTTAYESQAWDGLDMAPIAIIEGADVNTALRKAEEKANKDIDTYLSSRK